jgi:archaellum component FlaC
LPRHVCEVELSALPQQRWQLERIGKQLRLIRNTVLGQVLKQYRQMVRTKEYKKLSKKFKALCEQIEKTSNDNKEKLQELNKEKKALNKLFEQLRNKHNVTFEYTRKYGEELRKTTFTLPDAVTVLSVCEMAWHSMEGLLYRNSKRVHFYKASEMVTFQGKQDNRCIILKQKPKGKGFAVTFNNMEMPVIFKNKDLYLQETFANIVEYMKNSAEIDKKNILRYQAGLPLIPTYRICNNRIVRREIRGKIRYYLQIVLEGSPVIKRKKDGSFRHSLGVGRVAEDIGIQSSAVTTKDKVILKNFAERSSHTFDYERKIYLLQRYLDRSLRASNPQNYDGKSRIKKGKKTWVFTKRYRKALIKFRELHRKAAASRKYAHNEDINYLRSLGDELIIEVMDIKALQKKAKKDTINEKTGKHNRRKRFGKSISKRSPGYNIKQSKYKFETTGGTVKEVNKWTFKASQYDHVLDVTIKKPLSQRWHILPDGTKVQRDIYSSFLLYCANEDLTVPNKKLCDEYFEKFLKLHDQCIADIIQNRKVVMNSGIKLPA